MIFFKRLPLEVRFFFFAWLLALPFVGRAYFVDDHYHLLMSRGILDHPTRPYDFLADDDGAGNAGWERGGFPRMVNPPLHHFVMAAWLWATGDPSLGPSSQHPSGGGRIWLVRAGMAAFSALSIPLLALLARRCLVPPGPAAALAMVTPAFWLSSYALLIDSTLLTFFLGSLVAWIEGLKRGRAWLLALSGLLMGATLLTKYTGGFVVPLAGLYWLLEGDAQGRRRPWPLLFLALPALVLAGWTAWNVETYGASHLLESSKRVMQVFAWNHVLIFLTFFSGVLLFPLESWAWVWRRGRGAAAGAMAAAALFTAFLASPLGGFSIAQSALMSVLFFGGMFFFLRVFTVAPKPSSIDVFLLVWLAVGAVQMIYVMQWVAARYYLTILPPAVLLVLRVWTRERPHAPLAFSRWTGGWTAATAVFALALGVGDWAQAATSRRLAADAEKDGWLASGRRCFYLGDSFTSTPLRYAGWSPAFPNTPLAPGDLVMRQEVIMPAWWFRTGARTLRPVAVYEYSSRWPLRVMDNAGAAGFYASAWGALPWTFSRGPLERYTLLEVLAD